MKRLSTAIAAATVVIAACGGGGGGLSGTQDPADAFAISVGNAETVAKLSYEAALGSGELADLGGSLNTRAAGDAVLRRLE